MKSYILSASCLLVSVILIAKQTSAFRSAPNIWPVDPSYSAVRKMTQSASTEQVLSDTYKNAAKVMPIVLSAFVFVTVPQSALGGDITRGSEVFAANCVGCHRGGQNFIKEQKTLEKHALEKYVGLNEENISSFFKNSFVHKVQVGGKLTDEEVIDVVSYVVDQATGEKW